jgi:hypothetical protein
MIKIMLFLSVMCLTFLGCKTTNKNDTDSLVKSGASGSDDLFKYCLNIISGKMEFVHRQKLLMKPQRICVDEGKNEIVISTGSGNNINHLARLKFQTKVSVSGQEFRRVYSVLDGEVQGQPLKLDRNEREAIFYQIVVSEANLQGGLSIMETVAQNGQTKDFTGFLKVTRTGLLKPGVSEDTSGNANGKIGGSCQQFAGLWKKIGCQEAGENTPNTVEVKQNACKQIRLFGTTFDIFDGAPPQSHSRRFATWDLNLNNKRSNLRASNLIITPEFARKDLATFILRQEQGKLLMHISQKTEIEMQPTTNLKCTYQKQ